MTKYLDNIQKPWSAEHIRAATFKSFTKAREAIEATSGGVLWNSLRALEDTRFIFDSSVSDLLDEISLFADRSKSPAFWDTSNSDKTETHQRNVKRRLYYSTSAMMTLVDHARIFERSYPVKLYTEKLSEGFSTTPNLHAFLQDLRNFNTHWRIAEANWEINTSSETKLQVARFVVTKKNLLAWSGWKANSKQFIQDAEDKIDIYNLFETYRIKVKNFYEWHKGRVIEEYSDIINEYLVYKRQYEGIQKASHWNLIMTYASKNINPYQYLDRYLTDKQMEKVLAFPHGSKEQVDCIIHAFDMADFCDEGLREKVEVFFNKK